MSEIILSGTTKEDLLNAFRAIVKEEIQSNKEQELQALYLSPAKVCAMFNPQISKTTLWNWVNDGKIKRYVIGGKPVYKYSEVIKAVETIQRYKKAS